MGFSLFSNQTTPIAIDFGSSSVKLLQIAGDERPSLVAAAEIHVPDDVRADTERLFAFYAEELPRALAEGGFKGRRVVMGNPSSQTFIQHMQLPIVDSMGRDDLIKGQLQTQTGCVPGSVVVRSIEVGRVNRSGQTQLEVICFAIARDTVMRYVNLFKRCKAKVVGVHTEAMALVRAFDHINRREGDEKLSTMYVDLGWGGTQVAIAHGRQVVFARHIAIGGRSMDQHIARTLHCDITTARSHRLTVEPERIASGAARRDREEAGTGAALLRAAAAAHEASHDQAHTAESEIGTATENDRRTDEGPFATCHLVPTGDPVRTAADVDLTELMDTIADEVSMCVRYHQGLFTTRPIDRIILLGGEARQTWLCQHLVRSLRAPAQLGDPLVRVTRDKAPTTPGVDFDQMQPGWTVAYGLCTAPTDL